MPPEVGHLHKLPVTVCARVRLLAGVEPHVCLEVVVSGEPFVAHLALEGLLTGMGALVVLQDMLVSK